MVQLISTSCAAIFSNIEVIYRCNSVLLKDIELCLKEEPRVSSLGRIFLNLAPYLKLYMEYVSILFFPRQLRSTSWVFLVRLLLIDVAFRVSSIIEPFCYSLILSETIR